MDRRRAVAFLALAVVLAVASTSNPNSWFLMAATGCVLFVLNEYAYRRQQGR